MSLAGTIYQFFPGYIDHIVPLSSILNIPLIITEKEISDLIKKFYPKTKTILYDDYLTYCPFLLSKFKIIFTCQLYYSDPIANTLLNSCSNNYTTIWLPHGNSDKGHENGIFQTLEKEKITLVYGNQMLDTFKKQKVYDKIKHKIIVGNYRKYYYQQNKSFYSKIIQREIKKKLPENNLTILYAPTWEDYEDNGSYHDAISLLLEKLPDNYNLIVKPHHNTYLRYYSKMMMLHNRFENQKNIIFLKDFPAIYPLLDFSDIYLGDMSSIGYDFLYFNKPMFFLNNKIKDSKKNPSLYLFRCGIEILPSQYSTIYDIIDEKTKSDHQFKNIRKEVYTYAFGKVPNFKSLKKKIISIHNEG